MLAAAVDIPMLIVGRFIVGTGIGKRTHLDNVILMLSSGIAANIVPIYVAEVMFFFRCHRVTAIPFLGVTCEVQGITCHRQQLVHHFWTIYFLSGRFCICASD